MSPRRLWRRLLAIWPHKRAPLVPFHESADRGPAGDRAALANDLLETLNPQILFSAGHLRYRRVYRRRIRYARLRQGPHGPQGPHSPIIDHRV